MKNYPYELYFVKPEYLKEEVLKDLVWDDIDVEKEPINAYNFKGVTTISKENPHVSLFKQYGEKFTFSSIEEILAFYKSLEQFPLDTMMTNRLKDSYLILVAEGLPPLHLIERISGFKLGFSYFYAGHIITTLIQELLKQHSHYSAEKLLDWGCGCGRIANQLILQKNIDYTGCDIDKEAIDWCTSNLTEGKFFVNEFVPPLPVQDNTYTTVFASSVMTHLGQKHQKRWLKEIHRVLQPDGLFIATTLGKASAERLGEADQLSTKHYYERISNAIEGIAPENQYKDTFQTKEYTYQHWTKYFDILEYNEQAIFNHQDLVVLRKKKVRKWFQF